METSMARIKMLVMAGLLAGCSGKSEDDSGAGADAGPEPQIVGTVTPETGGVTADFAIYKAFGFDQGGSLIMYLSSTPEASCETVTQYLNVGRGDPYDPVSVMSGGTCNMLLEVPATVGYEGELTWTRSEGDGGIDEISATSAIECAMGTGAFEVTTLSENDDPDYYWTGDNAHWWQGTVVGYSLELSGGGGEPYEVSLDISTLKGGFVREGFAGNDPASGNVSGTIQAEWCTSLGSTGLFGR
jgi:hypothetical protein